VGEDKYPCLTPAPKIELLTPMEKPFYDVFR